VRVKMTVSEHTSKLLMESLLNLLNDEINGYNECPNATETSTRILNLSLAIRNISDASGAAA